MARSHYDEIAMKLAPEITEQIAAFESSVDQGGIQGFGSMLRDRLKEADLAYEIDNVNFAHVAVWEDNREKEMLIPARVSTLIGIFCAKGFAGKETLLALAREVLDGPSGDQTRQKNADLIESTRIEDSYLIAPFKDLKDIKFATGVGSHTYAAVRAINFVRHGGKIRETEVTKDLDVSTCGFLSFQKIAEKAPGVQEVLDKGMPKLFVLRAAFADLVPDAMRILSEADNAKHDNFQQESFMQTMHNIHRRIQNTNPKSDDHYVKIARQVSRSKKPDQLNAAASYTEYVRNYAGADKMLLLEIEDYIRQLSVVREVPHEFFKELAKLELWHMALYIVALVKATASCPKAFVKSGKARVFLPTDLSSITGANAAKVEKAWKMQVEARDMAKALGIAQGALYVKILGDFDTRLVFNVHDKKSDKRQAFDSLNAIGVQYYTDLEVKFGKELVRNVKCPWNVVEIAKRQGASKPAIYAVNDRGVLTPEIMHQLGFAVEGNVKMKKDAEVVNQITMVGDAEVTLWNGTSLVIVQFKELVANWVPHVEEAKVCSLRVVALFLCTRRNFSFSTRVHLQCMHGR